MLTIFEDGTFELRWIDYAQTSALFSEQNPQEEMPDDVDVNQWYMGNINFMSKETLEFLPTTYYN